MKAFKRTFLSLLAIVCLVFGAAFSAACGDNGGDKGDAYYTVTLSYDEAKGTVTKSDPASADGYVKDETVTVTVTAKQGYEVGAVHANTTPLTAGADGKYSFKVAGNTTVTLSFNDVGEPVLLDASLYGTYKDLEGAADDLVVSATGVKWGDKNVYLASPHADDDLFYAVTVDGAAYELHVSAEDGTISLNSSDFTTDVTFLKEGRTLSYTVSLTKSGEGTAELSPVKEKYDQGDEVTLTVSPAEDWFLKDVIVNGETVSVEDGEYTFNVTRNTTIAVTFLAEGEIPAEFQGAWKNIEDSADTFTLTADGMTWAGHEVTVESIAVYADYFDPTPLGTVITVTIDGDRGNTIQLLYGATAVEVMWNSAEGLEDRYYVLGDGTAIGDGLLAPGAFSEVGGTGKLSVSDAGAVTLGGAALKLYFTGTQYLFYNDGLYTFNINNNNYVVVSDPADYFNTTDYVRDTISLTPLAVLVGEWSESGGGKLVVNADGSTTLTGVDALTAIKLVYSDLSGTTVLLTTASGTAVDSISLSMYEGEWSFGFYLDDGMAQFTKAGERVVLGEKWQTGYEYDGAEEYVDPARFIANENGIALLNDFDAPIESSYFYGAKASDTEYVVWVGYYLYTLTLNDDGTIALSDGSATHVYAPCEIVPQDVFSVTLQYDVDQGYATLSGETPDEWGGDVYTLAKPETGTYDITILVTPSAGYKVKSVTVGGTAHVDANNNGRYAYSADGTANVTVVITFEEAELDPLTISDTSLYGTYSGTNSVGDDTTVKKIAIDASGVKFENETVYLLDGSDAPRYSVKIGEKTYTLNIDAAHKTIDMSDAFFSEDYHFTMDGGSTSPTTYTVTIEYGEGYTSAMGSASADKTSYNGGETVTIAVTVNAGYEIELVTANGETLSVNASGTYTFEISENTTVTVSFKSAS